MELFMLLLLQEELVTLPLLNSLIATTLDRIPAMIDRLAEAMPHPLIV
jgi:hypothetical protein